MECDNVNGFRLSLKIDTGIGHQNSRKFTIIFKTRQNKSVWPKISLIFAVIINFFALTYVRISPTAMSVIIIVCAFLAFFWITHTVQSESILVIPTVGIQSTVKYVFGQIENFVPWSSIDDVIINEVIRLNRVLYFLTVLVKTRNPNQETENIKLMTLFKFTKPRLVMIQSIYSELQTLLTESRTGGSDMASGDTG